MTTNGKKIKRYFSKNLAFNKISDREFDHLVLKAMEPLYDRALEKTLLDREDCIRKPKRICGLQVSHNGGIEFKYKKGDDGYVRYIPIAVTILNFTPHEIVIYQCVLDPTTEKALNESTWTYFYEEVVSIETREVSTTKEKLSTVKKVINEIPIIKKLVKGTHEQYNLSKKFMLTTRGTSRLEVQLSDYEVIEETIGGEFNITDAENTIRSIRTVLRDKKRN